jgi:hypothetical protein
MGRDRLDGVHRMILVCLANVLCADTRERGHRSQTHVSECVASFHIAGGKSEVSDVLETLVIREV